MVTILERPGLVILDRVAMIWSSQLELGKKYMTTTYYSGVPELGESQMCLPTLIGSQSYDGIDV